MIASSRYRVLLKAMFSAVYQSGLSAADCQLLVEELRRGRLADELAYMIERANEHFVDNRSREEDPRIVSAEKIMKGQRVQRISLLNIIKSIEPGFAQPSSKDSIRTVLRQFFSTSTSSQGAKLLDILKSAGGDDAYLKGISDRRR